MARGWIPRTEPPRRRRLRRNLANVLRDLGDLEERSGSPGTRSPSGSRSCRSSTRDRDRPTGPAGPVPSRLRRGAERLYGKVFAAPLRLLPAARHRQPGLPRTLATIARDHAGSRAPRQRPARPPGGPAPPAGPRPPALLPRPSSSSASAGPTSPCRGLRQTQEAAGRPAAGLVGALRPRSGGWCRASAALRRRAGAARPGEEGSTTAPRCSARSSAAAPHAGRELAACCAPRRRRSGGSADEARPGRRSPGARRGAAGVGEHDPRYADPAGPGSPRRSAGGSRGGIQTAGRAVEIARAAGTRRPPPAGPRAGRARQRRGDRLEAEALTIGARRVAEDRAGFLADRGGAREPRGLYLTSGRAERALPRSSARSRSPPRSTARSLPRLCAGASSAPRPSRPADASPRRWTSTGRSATAPSGPAISAWPPTPGSRPARSTC